MYFHFPRMSFTLKSGKIHAGISTVPQFHEFFKSNFWQVFDIFYCAACFALVFCAVRMHSHIQSSDWSLLAT